jgi:3-hydroxyacyl-CoA dehydrogenase
VLDHLQRLTQQFGERFWPAPVLKRMVAAGRLGVKTGKGFFTYA